MVLAATGCSELSDRLDDSVNRIASDALEKAVKDELGRQGIQLDGDPDCSTDLSRDGASLTGDASCAATTAEGHNAQATFSGTLSGSGCSGSLEVVVEGRTVVDLAEIPDCSVSL